MNKINADEEDINANEEYMFETYEEDMIFRIKIVSDELCRKSKGKIVKYNNTSEYKNNNLNSLYKIYDKLLMLYKDYENMITKRNLCMSLLYLSVPPNELNRRSLKFIQILYNKILEMYTKEFNISLVNLNIYLENLNSMIFDF